MTSVELEKMKRRFEPRFVRLEDAYKRFGMRQEMFPTIAEASGAVFNLGRIRLVKVKEFKDYMKHFTKIGKQARPIEQKYVRVSEASIIYNIGMHRIIEMARAAGAVYKIGESKGSMVLISLDVFDEYMEQFRLPPVEMKNPLWQKEEEDGIL